MFRTPIQKRHSAILAASITTLLGLGLLLSAPRAAADEYWDGSNPGSSTPNGSGGDGTWDNNTMNWSDKTGAVSQKYDSTDHAFFATKAGTVTLGDNITFTTLEFQVDGYTVNQDAGAIFSLSPVAGAIITVDSGFTSTINAPMTGSGDITVPGPGTLVLAGNSSFTGGATLSGGTLNLNHNNALGGSAGGTLRINGGTIGTTLAGGVTIPNPVVVGGDFSVATNVDTSNAGNQNFTFANTVDLGGTTRTITGVTPGGQVTFSNVISGGAAVGITFTTNATTVDGDPTNPYVAFIYSDQTGGNPFINQYTGTTTVTGHAILVLENSTPNAAIQGNVDVEGNGVVDYIGGANFPDQIIDSATVTVNSPGNTISGGTHFDGLELRGASDTIGMLMGTNPLATVGLGSGTLTISQGGNYAGIIEDGAFGSGGNLTLDAPSGTLVLSAAPTGGNTTGNTYTGLTTITAGTLQAGADMTFSSASPVLIDTNGVLDLNDHPQTVGAISDPIGGVTGGTGGHINLGKATLTFGGDNFDTSFSGVIEGASGSITKVGTGTTELTGASTFTGPTTINAGAITLDSGGTSVSPVIVNSMGTFNLGVTGTLNTGASTPVTVNTDGTFTNAGTLAVAGAASQVHLTADGALAYNFTGATIGGTTAVLVDNPSGIATVINYGTITGTTASVDATGSKGVTIGDFGTFTGPSGSGVEFSTGTNTVILGTQIPYTPITGGASGNDTLRLAGSSADTVSLTAFPGYEFLNKVGGGMWTLTGTNPFSGGATISGGTLNVQGTLVSNTVVQPMGTLSGTGTVAGNVSNFGIVMPGIPSSVLTPVITPGTLSVKGAYTQSSTGALTIQVNGDRAGQYSQLSISGHAQLNGFLVIQNGNSQGLKLGDKLTILTAGGGVSGTFSDVANPFATGSLIVGKVVYESNDVVLEAAQGSFLSIDSQFHLTHNQKAVATALDNAGSDPRATQLLTYLDNQPLKKLPGDFDLIAPEEMASVYRIGISLADVQARNLQRRAADLRAGASGFSTTGFQSTGGLNYSGGITGANGASGPDGANGKSVSAPIPDQRWGTFITGVGDFVHVGDSANASGYDLDTGGVTVGADYKVNDHLAVGLTAGYAGTTANLTNDGRLLVNGGKVGVYGTYYTGGFHTDAAVTGGYNNYSTRRSALQGDAIGRTEGGEVDVLADAGYDWRLDALTIGPTASFQYTSVGVDGFTERGSLAPLRYAGQQQSSLRSTLGIRMAYDWKVGSVIVRPEGEFAWQHEYGDRSYSIDSALASGAGSMFSVQDTQLGRDSLLFGGGVSVLWNPRTSTYLYYDADLLKKEYYSQSVTGGLRMNF